MTSLGAPVFVVDYDPAGPFRLLGDVEIPAAEAVGAEVIEREVARGCGIKPQVLREVRKRIGEARGIYIEMLCTTGRKTQREVAGMLGVSEHAVCKCRQRFREQVREKKVLSAKLPS